MTDPTASPRSGQLDAGPASASETCSATTPQADPTARALRDALGTFATGVAIAATNASDGRPVGLTINSFASVSLRPPLVLWSIDHGASVYSAFAQATCFSVNVLAADHQAMALRFAGSHAPRFSEPGWAQPGTAQNTAGSSPILTCALAYFDCKVAARHAGGDHDILVGEVLSFGSRRGAALGYLRGKFVALEQS